MSQKTARFQKETCAHIGFNGTPVEREGVTEAELKAKIDDIDFRNGKKGGKVGAKIKSGPKFSRPVASKNKS